MTTIYVIVEYHYKTTIDSEVQVSLIAAFKSKESAKKNLLQTPATKQEVQEVELQ